jgi:hypothetical protein
MAKPRVEKGNDTVSKTTNSAFGFVFQRGVARSIQARVRPAHGLLNQFAQYTKKACQLADQSAIKKPLTSAPARRNFPIRRNHNILCVAAAGKPKPWVCRLRGIGVQPALAWTFGGGANGEN